MDVSTIKPPVEKTEGEQHPNTPQESDPTFLQLLAGLGLIPPAPPIPTDADKLLAANGELSLALDAIQVAHAGSSATIAGQEIIAVANPQDANALLAKPIQPSPEGTMAGDLLTHILTSAGKPASDTAATVPTQPVTIGTAQTIEGKPPAPVAFLSDIKGAVQNASDATISKDVPQGVLAKLVDAVSSDSAPKERESASAVIPAPIGLAPNASIHPSVGQDMPIKQPSASTPTLTWDAVLESSNLPAAGKGNDPSLADHDEGKERFPQPEPGTSQAAPAPLTSSFSSQSSPSAIRSTASVEAPAVTAPLESSLPASVRFEVQQGDMGRIRVHVSVVDHTVYTNVLTDRIEAHDFLVKGSDRYEAGLAAHGLDVGRFQVDVQGQSREQADRDGTGWSQQQTTRQRAESSKAEVPEWQAEERKVEWDNRMVNVFA